MVNFASNFYEDESNRLDPLKEDRLADSDAPEQTKKIATTSLQTGDKIRAELKKSEIPEAPTDTNSPAEFFTKVQETVAREWNARTEKRITKLQRKWIGSIETEGKYPKGVIEQTFPTLFDISRLNEAIQLQQLGNLEALSEISPAIWRDLLALAQEKSFAEIELARAWAKQIGNPEIEIATDIAVLTGKYANQAYFKQMELAATEGGTEKDEVLQDTEGAERLFGLPNGKVQTYPETFPLEISRIAKRLEMVAAKTEQYLVEDQLPESYRSFPEYLRAYAAAYSSQEKDPQTLAKTWEALFTMRDNLIREGCPIILIPQRTAAVMGDANKIDFEMRIAFASSKDDPLQQEFTEFSKAEAALNSQHKDILSEKELEPTEVSINYQTFGSGPNLFYLTPAEEGEIIMHHRNTIESKVERNELQHFRKLFPAEQFDMEIQKRASSIEDGLHELGHNILPKTTNQTIVKRTGQGNEQAIIEELKAETAGIKVLQERYDNQVPEEIARRQFISKIGVQLDALANKPDDEGSFGGRYHWAAVKIIAELLDQDIIQEAADPAQGYTITDPQKGLQTIAKIGDEVLTLYADTSTTPDTISSYYQSFKGKKEDPKFQKFLAALKKVV